MKIYIPENLRVFVRSYDNMIYLVPDNKTSSTHRMCENARNWAGKPCKEFVVKNDDIKLHIVSSPETSTQGGKLSFSICGVKFNGDNNCYNIGIKTDALFEYLKHNTCKNGVFDEKFFFVRNNTSWDILNSAMQYPVELGRITKTEVKKIPAVTKSDDLITTTCFNVGCLYKYKTNDFRYIYTSEIYQYIKLEELYFPGIEYIRSFNKPVKKNLFISNEYINDKPIYENILLSIQMAKQRNTLVDLSEKVDYDLTVSNAGLKDYLLNYTINKHNVKYDDLRSYILLCFTSFEKNKKQKYSADEIDIIMNKIDEMLDIINIRMIDGFNLMKDIRENLYL